MNELSTNPKYERTRRLLQASTLAAAGWLWPLGIRGAAPSPDGVTGEVVAAAVGFQGKLKVEQVQETRAWADVGRPTWFLHVEAEDGSFPPTGMVRFDAPAYLTPEGVRRFETEMARYQDFIRQEQEERMRKAGRVENAERRQQLLRQVEAFRDEAQAKAVNRKAVLPDGRAVYSHRGWKFYRAELAGPDGDGELVVMMSTDAPVKAMLSEAVDSVKKRNADSHGFVQALAIAVDAAIFPSQPAADDP